MSPKLQTLLALAAVAIALAYLIWRAIAKRNKPGCGGGCACPSAEIKEQLTRTRRK